jgi:exosortase
MLKFLNIPKDALPKIIIAKVLFLITYFPTLVWMWERWFARDSYYSHGILVPFVTGYLIWQKKDELTKISWKESAWGIRLIIFGIILHIFSAAFRIYFSSGFSMLIVFIGMMLYFVGEEYLKKIIFPISFLVFMIPIPEVAIVNISFKLKLFAAEIATIILNNMRIPALREGSVIKMRHAQVVVDDVCSGLRSLISLTALGSIFAYWMKGAMWRKVLLFLSTIPIAVITNVVRVIFLSAISEIWGPQYASGTVHDITGFMVFALAFILLYAVGKLLESDETSKD